MNLTIRKEIIVQLVFLSVLFSASPAEACVKKLRTLLRKETPADLQKEDASLIKYSNAGKNDLFLEISGKSFVIREMARPPIVKSQVAGEDLMRIMNKTNTKEANGGKNANMISAVGEDFSLSKSLPQTAEKSENGEDVEEEEEEILSPEDEGIRAEWSGKCKMIDWNRCNKIRKIVVMNVINNQFQTKHLQLNCLTEPILCLKNGWTANRCHILCMAAQCNKEIFFDWDAVVDFEGPCKYRK